MSKTMEQMARELMEHDKRQNCKCNEVPCFVCVYEPSCVGCVLRRLTEAGIRAAYERMVKGERVDWTPVELPPLGQKIDNHPLHGSFKNQKGAAHE